MIINFLSTKIICGYLEYLSFLFWLRAVAFVDGDDDDDTSKDTDDDPDPGTA